MSEKVEAAVSVERMGTMFSMVVKKRSQLQGLITQSGPPSIIYLSYYHSEVPMLSNRTFLLGYFCINTVQVIS